MSQAEIDDIIERLGNTGGGHIIAAITPQPAHAEQGGWIKCSDDLPLIGVEVQVYIPGNAQTGRPTVTAMARFVNRQGAPDYFWDKSTGKGGDDFRHFCNSLASSRRRP